MLQEPITPEKQKHLEGILDRVRSDALKDPKVSFLTIVKYEGHPQIMAESGGDDGEREKLMEFFLKWAFGKSAETFHKTGGK